MCGIIGYTGKSNAVPYLLQGLHSLEYRGYDSAGVAVVSDGEIGFCKCKGRVSVLEKTLNKKSVEAFTGIGHTRWATHGRPSVANAHPHLSHSKKFAVVHNGIIENYSSIKNELIKKGYTFKSDTDTEVIPNLLESLYDGDPLQTLIECVCMLDGSFALAVLCKDVPDGIFCVRRNNPLVLCEEEGGVLLSSDATALLKYTDTVYKPQDNCPVLITKNAIEFFDADGKRTLCEKEKITWDADEADKGGYEHYMRKEIMQQPEAVKKTLESVAVQVRDIAGELRRFTKIHIVACGSAYHVAMTGKYVIELLSSVQCECHIASEFRYSSIPLSHDHLCIIISQSGETADSLAALKKAKNEGVHTLSIVNVQGSSIATESDTVIHTKAGPEIAVATTKAYSAQLSVIYFIAALLCSDEDKREKYIKKIFALPELIQKSLQMCENMCMMLSSLFDNVKSAYFIGRNTDYPSAEEGALKMKEISYIHCEAYAAGELKHGTISLVEKGTVVVAVMTNEHIFTKTLSNVREVQSRGATVIFITTEKNVHLLKGERYVITVPDCDELLSAGVSVVPLQLLSYHTAVRRGCDIDKPRNLAKSVTVE